MGNQAARRCIAGIMIVFDNGDITPTTRPMRSALLGYLQSRGADNAAIKRLERAIREDITNASGCSRCGSERYEPDAAWMPRCAKCGTIPKSSYVLPFELIRTAELALLPGDADADERDAAIQRAQQLYERRIVAAS